MNRIADLKEEFFNQRATLLEDIENSVCLKKVGRYSVDRPERRKGKLRRSRRKEEVYDVGKTGDIEEGALKLTLINFWEIEVWGLLNYFSPKLKQLINFLITPFS